MKRVLVLTNMEKTKTSPYVGQFVRDQVFQLQAKESLDVKFFDMPHCRLKWLRYPKFLLTFLCKARHFDADIVHVHFYFPTIILAHCYRRLFRPECKIMVTFHGSDVFLYGNKHRLYRRGLKQIDYGLFVSQGLFSQFKKKFGEPGFPYKVLCAGIKSVFFRKPVTNLDQKNYDLVFVGTMDTNKGTDRLLHILQHCQKPLHIALIGNGSRKRTCWKRCLLVTL